MVRDVPGQHGEHCVGAEGERDEVPGALDTLMHVWVGAEGPVHQRRHSQVLRSIFSEERRLFDDSPASGGTLLHVELRGRAGCYWRSWMEEMGGGCRTERERALGRASGWVEEVILKG